ncbi:MAG: substrate-binding domain-containing protein, partial [Alphaproteobacteria bacterium]|nr:substrate-binding domain-containing protein [Alphaproteobacteria bacterium]
MGFALVLVFLHLSPSKVSVVSETTDKVKPSVEKPTDKPSKQIVIGYSMPKFRTTQPRIMQGFKDRAEAKGWKVIVLNADANAEVQEKQIDHFISQKVDAIVAVPDDCKRIASSIKKAEAAGIPFYTIDRAPIGYPIDIVVSSDNVLASSQSAEALVKLLTERYGEPKGTVIEFQGDLKHDVSQNL